MIPCPECANKGLKRSHPKGFVEEHILPLLKLAPYLCPSCGRRFYRYYPGKSASTLSAPQEPGLPVTFLQAEDGVSFQQLIKNLRDAEKRLNTKGVAQRELSS